MPRVILYTKTDCSLCESAAEVLARVRDRHPFELEVVDIAPDPKLMSQYGHRIPVVLLDGEPAFEYFVDEGDLESLLTAGARA